MVKKLKPVKALAASMVAVTLVSGCGSGSSLISQTEGPETSTQVSSTAESESGTETEPVVELPERPQKPEGDFENLVYEGEEAVYTGNAFAGTDSNCSGGGYADGLNVAMEDQISFKVDVPYDYYYNLTFKASSGGQEKYNYILVDGQEIGELLTQSSDYTDCTLGPVYLEAGSHEIGILCYWGYVKYDNLTISLAEPPDESIYEVSDSLINPNADDNTKRVMRFLTDVYGKQFLTGQYGDEGFFSNEVQAIYNVTGELPAVLGLDMIEYSPSRAENGSTSQTVEMAIDWWNRGGIVTICWHWNAPSKYLTGVWYDGFRKTGTNISLSKIMNGEDEEGYELLMSDIDVIAGKLKELQDAGVPVLWRPLHEASGGWFWWGASGAEAYKKLWILMYDKLTNEHGLNNLIWLWNGQSADWYPGDEYVDIIGEDIYPGNQVTSSQVSKYMEAVNYTSADKMVVLSENGCVFDPESAYIDGAMWGFYCTWGSEFVLKTDALPRYSEKYTTEEALKKMYDSPLSLTLDELPDLKNYPLD